MGDHSELYPLTHAQRRIYIPGMTNPASYRPVICYQVRFHEPVDLDQLANAIHATIEHTDALRTRLVPDEGQLPCQEFPVYQRRPLNSLDFRGRSQADFDQWAREQGVRAMDLFQGPLFDFTLIRFPDGKSGYAMRVHHLCVDGTSCIQLVREIAARVRGEEPATPSVSCTALGAAEQAYLASEQVERDRDFWMSRDLHLLTPVTLVPPRPIPAESLFDTVQFPVPDELAKQMGRFQKDTRVSPFVQLLAALSLYIHRVTDRDRFGLTFYGHGRGSETLRAVCGMGVESLPLAVDLNGLNTFGDILERLSGAVREIVKHHGRFPFDELVRLVRREHGADINHLFNLSVIELVYPDLETCEMTQVHHLNMQNQLSVLLERFDRPERTATIQFTFDATLVDRADVASLYAGICSILETGLTQPDQPLSGMPLLSHDGFRQVIHEFNRTDAPYPEDKCVHQLFEAVVDRQPDAVAIEWDTHTITYGQLNHRADDLADMLLRAGVGPETRVAVFMEKSIAMVAAFLAVLKAGGAYVPIDPGLPDRRIAFLLDDAAPHLLIINHDLRGRAVGFTGTRIISRDQQFESQGEMPKISAATNASSPDNLMYVIYTSGSTGRPKGVLVEHRGFVNLIHDQVKRYALTENDRFLHVLSFSFDAAHEHLFRALCSGTVLCLADLKVPDQQDVRELLRTRRITCCPFPASLLETLDDTDFPDLVALSSGADKCSVALFRRWSRGRRFFNAYGPTEVTVMATISRLDEQETEPHIGNPIANLKAYVLDRYRMPVPVGAEGELYLGGAGVARGYLNRPDLTASAFIPDPFDPTGQGRLYRTGDMCRWRPDGNLVFIGRKDKQVKIRGFRVELDEVRARMLECTGVKDAAVVAYGTGGCRQLAGFVVGADPSVMQGLPGCLQDALPSHMVPEQLFAVSRIPRTLSGKVNEPALLSMMQSGKGKRSRIVPRLSGTERQLNMLWGSLLGYRKIDPEENFFHIGGDSLLALEVCVAIEQQFGLRIPLQQFMQAPTLRGVAALVDRNCTDRETVHEIRTVPDPCGTFVACHSFYGERVVAGLVGRSLDDTVTCLALSMNGESLTTHGISTVPQLAEFHVNRLLDGELCAPVIMFGTSWSGILAYEMALVLEQRGYASHVIIVDTGFPGKCVQGKPSRISCALFAGCRALGYGLKALVLKTATLVMPGRMHYRLGLMEALLELRLFCRSGAAVGDVTLPLDQRLRLLDDTLTESSDSLSGDYLLTDSDNLLRRMLLPGRLDSWKKHMPQPLAVHRLPGSHWDLVRKNLPRTISCVQQIIHRVVRSHP